VQFKKLQAISMMSPGTLIPNKQLLEKSTFKPDADSKPVIPTITIKYISA